MKISSFSCILKRLTLTIKFSRWRCGVLHCAIVHNDYEGCSVVGHLVHSSSGCARNIWLLLPPQADLAAENELTVDLVPPGTMILTRITLDVWGINGLAMGGVKVKESWPHEKFRSVVDSKFMYIRSLGNLISSRKPVVR